MKAKINWFEYRSTMANCFTPKDSTNFHELVTMQIGPEDSDGGDYFYLYIVTPQFLNSSFELEEKFEAEWGCYHLIVPYWNQKLIEEKIQIIVDKHGQGDDWVKVAGRLSKYFQWEFENYQAELL